MINNQIYEKIYNKAFDIFVQSDGTDRNTYDYLMEEVNKGKININDAHCILKDIWKENEA